MSIIWFFNLWRKLLLSGGKGKRINVKGKRITKEKEKGLNKKKNYKEEKDKRIEVNNNKVSDIP